MNGTIRRWAVVTGVVVGGCSVSQRPVLYPNPQLSSVRPATAQQDIDDCLELAANYSGLQGQGVTATKQAARGAATGAVVGTAVGAVRGDVGDAAAAGAAGGAALGMMNGLVLNVPDQATRRFVEQCLRDKGYQPIGWQ